MGPAAVVFLVPITAMLAVAGIAIVHVLARHRQRMQRTEFRHKERLAAIEKGLELPADPPEQEPVAAVDGSRFLRQGLVLVFVGAGITAGMMQLPGNDVPYLFGLVPAAVGVAYLLFYFVHRRHAAADVARGGGG